MTADQWDLVAANQQVAERAAEFCFRQREGGAYNGRLDDLYAAAQNGLIKSAARVRLDDSASMDSFNKNAFCYALQYARKTYQKDRVRARKTQELAERRRPTQGSSNLPNPSEILEFLSVEETRGSLPIGSTEILRLRFEGHSLEEVGLVMQMTLVSVKSHVKAIYDAIRSRHGLGGF